MRLHIPAYGSIREEARAHRQWAPKTLGKVVTADLVVEVFVGRSESPEFGSYI